MSIWDAVRRFSGAMKRGRAARTIAPRRGRHDVLGSLRARGLRMEQFEARVLLSITPPSGLADLESTVCPMEQYTYLSEDLAWAVYRVSDLTDYSATDLAVTRQWTVGVHNELAAPGLAASLGAEFVAYSPYLENATIWEFPEETSWITIADVLQHTDRIDYFYPLVPQEIELYAVPNDPLFADQWHLQNTGQSGGTAGVDANVVTAWDSVTGAGVVIGIVDDSLEHDHPDLAAHYRADLSYDFWDDDPDPSPSPGAIYGDNHGTAVGGVAAAVGNNSEGGSGSAPGASLAGIRLTSGWPTNWQVAQAFGWKNDQIDIYNNSWGWKRFLRPEDPQVLGAIMQGITTGRDGLGDIYTFAAGNERLEGSDVNYYPLQSSRYTIAVAAIDHDGHYSYYSVPGAAVFVSGHSNSYESDITTTDRTGEDGYNSTGSTDGDPLVDTDYTSTFGGTSSATPLVSGIIALILEANPGLTYRDVQHILANSSTKNDPNDPEWAQNGAGYWVNRNYGFGAVNASAAVELAKTWENVSEEVSTGGGVVHVGQDIADGGSTGVVSHVTLDDSIEKIEWAEVTVNIPHDRPGDIEVVLVSPAGTRSQLVAATSIEWDSWTYGGTYDHWTLSSCHFWGETSEGTWTLEVRDLLTGHTGTLDTWELNVYGTAEAVEPPEPPVVITIGPELVKVIPNEGGEIRNQTILNIAPLELKFLFSEQQVIDPATLSAIRIVRAGGDDVIGNANDVNIEYGWIGIGDRPNEVLVRFAETLPDDLYQITIVGDDSLGDVVLTNMDHSVFHGGENVTITFSLDLGAQVTAVVPQPTYRDATGQLQQSRNTIEVYFNDDPLDAASAENPEFYRLSKTSQTADPGDDVEFFPTSVAYDPIANKAVLTFADDLANLGTGAFRLRIGNEYQEIPTSSLPVEEVYVVGDTFASAHDVETLGSATTSASLIISSAVEALPYDLQWPGSIEEPGHRMVPESVLSQAHYLEGYLAADDEYGATTYYYNFRRIYGTLPSGSPAYNLITSEQKERTREIFELFSNYMGVQFVEDTTGTRGLTIVTGDMRVINPLIPTAPGGILAVYSGGMAIMDNAETWHDGYGGDWFQVAMRQIGHLLGLGNASDQPQATTMDESVNPFDPNPVYNDTDYYTVTAEDVFPGNTDIIHGQHIYRPDGTDVDIYQFTLPEAGSFSAEVTAERLANASMLDSVLTLYDAAGTMIARNDDYYSEDSYIDLALPAGVYYVAISSTGNAEFDADVADSGLGGLTQGKYDLRLTFQPDLVAATPGGVHIVDMDDVAAPGTGTHTKTQFDGDADGVPGGVYDYWLNVQPQSKTLYVDKLATSAGVRGNIAKPYSTIAAALAAAQTGDIVRIVGNRDRTYDADKTFEVSVDPVGTAVGDFDGDGAVDIVATNKEDDSVSILFGLGDGTYWADVVYDVGDQPGAVTVGDIDNDGDLDILAANQGDNTISILMNDGSGNFGTHITRFTGGNPSDVVLGDVNRDRILDIVVTNRDDNTVGVLLSGGIGIYADQKTYPVGAQPAGVDLGDLDNDGTIDIVVANQAGDSISIFLNQGDGTFPDIATVAAVGDGPSGIVVTDLDGNGNRDVVVSNGLGNSVSVLMGNGHGAFDPQIAYAAGTAPSGIAVADIDQDGAPDVVTSNKDSDSVSVFFGVGNGTLEAAASYGTGDRPMSVTLADVDGDARPDIVTANQGSAFNGGDAVSVLLARRDRAYNIGLDRYNNPLSDGSKMEVPKGVTVLVDAGAVIKLHDANLDVGSSSLQIDRSQGSLQVLGTPERSVYVTSYYDKSLGTWGTDIKPTDFDIVAKGGDWGGLVFRNDQDYDVGRTVLETQGIFLNYVNHAELRYGGGKVSVNGVQNVYNPVHMVEARPTVSFNTILYSADAAMSADPNSFADTKFEGADYTADYDRVGPDIHGNIVLKNSVNGIFVRIATLAGRALTEQDVCARWDDTDIVHVVAENLVIKGTPGGPTYDGNAQGNLTARLDARLTIDPGIIVKLDGSRIETEMSAQLLAEGTQAYPIIFSAMSDDTYGAGGTFDTGNNESLAAPMAGDWGGLYFAPASSGSVDHAYLAYGGGETRIEGGFAYFNTVEIHQADVRLANSVLANNAGVELVGSNPDTGMRAGRPSATPGVIFVRGAQPVIVGNVIRDNDAPAVSMNANSLTAALQGDPGRNTGRVDAHQAYDDNSGPLVRDNHLSNNDVNGMVVRGEVLTIDCVWDDTDIVHVVFDEIVVPNFHTYGGLRLQSDVDESLVVKFLGKTAGITALGTPQEFEDRIGGSLQILGEPGYPVILTSLADDTAGAGVDAWGNSQHDTDNAQNTPAPGDWRSVKLEEYVNDRNVDVVIEREDAYAAASDNDVAYHAQSLGDLAPSEQSGDDNLRLGFDVHGFIRTDNSNDVDVYTFTGRAGTEVWIDIDRTTLGLDSIVELIDAEGNVIASSDNSPAEDANGLNQPYGIAQTMNEDVWDVNNDMYTTSVHDAGMRVVLPGSDDALLSYYVRVRSNDADGDGQGDSSGGYQLQIRLHEEQEIPGSTVRNSSIRYATNGIELLGLPTNSPLLVEAAEVDAAEPGVPTPATATIILPGPHYDPLDPGDNNDFIVTANLPGSAYNAVQICFVDGRPNGINGNAARATFYPDQLMLVVEIDPYPTDIDLTPATTARTAVNAINNTRYFDQFSAALTETDNNQDNDGTGIIGRVGVVGQLAEGHMGGNSSFEGAEYLGNLADTDSGVLEVGGYLSKPVQNPDGTVEYDIDWYYFDLDMEKCNGANGIPWSTIFDVDYTDGMARPDTAVYVYSAGRATVDGETVWQGTLIYRSDDSNVEDDQLDPLAMEGVQDPSRGSAGTSDPYLGAATLGEGQYPDGVPIRYYVAIVSKGFVPVPTEQASLTDARQQLLASLGAWVPYVPVDQRNSRVEPVNSVTQVADDNVGGSGAHGVPGTQTVLFPDTDADMELSLHIDDYHLNDIATFISLAGTLYTIDPFTGAMEADVTGGYGLEIPGCGDIVMRKDGKLYGVVDVGYTGGFVRISTADGQLAHAQDPNGDVYTDAAGNPIDECVADDGIDTFTLGAEIGEVVLAGSGIEFTAMVYDENMSSGYDIYAVGHAADGQDDNPDPTMPLGYTTNLVYRFHVEDVMVDGVYITMVTPYSPFDTGDRLPSVAAPWGVLDLDGDLDYTDRDDGIVTGLDFVEGVLYAVDDKGRLFTIDGYNAPGTAPYDPPLDEDDNPTGAPTIEVTGGPTATLIVDLTTIFPDNCMENPDTGEKWIPFSALSAGPTDIEPYTDPVTGRKTYAYRHTLFATDTNKEGSQFFAFQVEIDEDPMTPDPTVTPASVFIDGQSVIGLRDLNGRPIKGVTGVAFSPADYNLWHITGTRGGDDGHDINSSVDGSRLGSGGGSSYYFGFEASGPFHNAGDYAQFDPMYQYEVYGTYDMPGGSHGSLTSDTFSLADYSAYDQPKLYFDYFLETDGAYDSYMTDAARVFISTDGANWTMLATNLYTGGLSGADDNAVRLSDGNMHEGYDVWLASANSVWFQAEVDLSAFAGMDNLRVRFDFSTAASMGVGETDYTGTYLAATVGSELADADTFELKQNSAADEVTHFEFDMGYSLMAPTSAGKFIADGEWFTLVNAAGARITFEFDRNGQVDGDNIAIPVTDADSAYAVARAIGLAIDSVTNLDPTVDDEAVPLPGVRGWVADDRVNLEGVAQVDQSADPTMTLVDNAPGTVDYRYVRIPALYNPSDNPQKRILDGETLTIEDVAGNVVTFEFDRAGGLNDPNNIAVPYVDNGVLDFDSSLKVANALANAVNQAIAAGRLTGTPDVPVTVTVTVDNKGTSTTRDDSAALTLTGVANRVDAITQSVDFTAPADDAPTVIIENTVLVPVHAGMTEAEVAAEIGVAFNGHYAEGATGTVLNPGLEMACKVNEGLVYVIGRVVKDDGPLNASTSLPGDSPAFPPVAPGTQFHSYLNGMDNNFEGFYIDNVMIGFAERGEMITGVRTIDSNPSLDFDDDADVNDAIDFRGGRSTSGLVTEGAYQLEIRAAADYGPLSESFDTNDRLSEDITLLAPAAGEVVHGAAFTISDGNYTQTFAFVDPTLPYTAEPGVVTIEINLGEDAAQIAQKITAAINAIAALDVTAESLATSNRIYLSGATAADGIDQVTFDYEGDNPTDIAAEDLNADGFLDVVTVNEGSDTITVLMQVPIPPAPMPVYMYEPVQYQVGHLPSAMELADVNGDGVMDVVVTNSGDGTVSVLLGNKQQVLTYRYVMVPELDAAHPQQIQDGELLTIFDEHQHSVIFEFDSDGSVETGHVAVAFDAVAYSPADIAQSLLAAIQQAVTDGSLVGVVATITGTRIRLQGVSDTSKYYEDTDPAPPKLVAMMDLIDPAIVSVDLASHAFETQRVFRVGQEPADLVVADLDADGRMDIVTANRYDDTVSILYGNGDGTFRDAVTLVAGSEPTSVEAADLNGDGIGDILVTNSLDNNVSVFLSVLDTVYAAPVNYHVGSLPVDIELADLDNSGTLDAITANRTSGTISVLLGVGNGTFAAALAFAAGASVVDVEVGHLNTDAFLDIATANHATNLVNVLYGTGTAGQGLLGAATAYANNTPYAGMTGPMGLAIGDLLADGRNDLITADYLSNTVTLNANRGTTFSIPNPITTGEPLGIWAAGDLRLTHMEGDTNLERAQGQIIIGANEILHSSEYGIKVDAGQRDYGSHPGPVAPLAKINEQELVPGVTIENNLVVDSGVGGILFSGDGGESGAVPFGRIVNNTVYGVEGVEFTLLDPGDVILEGTNDDYTDELALGFNMNFYGTAYNTFFVNNNGNITFVMPVVNGDPIAFPVNRPMIAPFWADVDTRATGEVRLARGTSVRGYDVVQIDWIDVGYFDGHDDKTNSFTLYIENDPEGVIVAFIYDDMHWTTGDAMAGAANGYGGAGAEIGFTSGTETDWLTFMRPASQAALDVLMSQKMYFWQFSPSTGMPSAITLDDIISPSAGIAVTDNASPTILNNIIVNAEVGIYVDGTCQTTVVGANAYQNNTTNQIGIALSPTAIVLGPDEPLFVDPEHGNFYLVAGSRAIDSSIDSLEERPEMKEVRDPLGIAPSPILAPDLDLYGQIRSDDPNAQPPSGVGSNVFKDRGAIDRVDFSAPMATIIDPMDNDPAGVDRDTTVGDVFVVDENLPVFSIQLRDTLGGIGIYDYSVTADKVTIYKGDSATPLELDTDYFFRYDAGTDVITLIAGPGLWEQGTRYKIVLDNSAQGIVDIAGNPLRPNRLDNTTYFTVSIAHMDFGDAPDPKYATKLESDGPRHLLIGDYYLGDGVTGEKDANFAVDPDTDELINDATGDAMDDGVSFTSALLVGETVSLNVKASSSRGYLHAWIDLNDDGDFVDEGEHVIASQHLSKGWNSLTFDLPGEGEVPYEIILGETIVRFRYIGFDDADPLGPTGGVPIGSTGEVLGGEVEDYQVILVDTLKDFGDAPYEPGKYSYPTLLANNGAYHELTTMMHLGATVDQELDGQPDDTARGDDLHGLLDETGEEPVVIDDEDGVRFTHWLVPGQGSQITVNASSAGYLNAWMDFNADGEWTADEQIADGLSLYAGDNIVSFSVPAGAVTGKTFARFRFSSEANLEPGGPAPDGEVEDYQILITGQPRDYGDAPRTYSTVENSEAATAHLILAGRHNDMLITAVTEGADWNDVKITFVNNHAVGDLAFVEYDATTKSLVIDVDPQKTTANTVVAAINTDPAVSAKFSAKLSDLADRNNDGTGLLPMTGTVGTTSGGADGFGEEAAYHVLRTDGGSLAVDDALFLGATVDAELDGQPHGQALGDDDTAYDDEDGVTLPTQFTAGTTKSFPIEVHLGVEAKAYLYGWIDFNRDGLFDDEEQVIYGKEITASGIYTETVTIPLAAEPGMTFARFRVSTDQGLSFDGAASDGEIEDYEVKIVRGTSVVSGFVFEDANRDGTFDANERGISGLTVYVDENNNGLLDVDSQGKPTEPFVVTMEDDLTTNDVDETGYYVFNGLAGRSNPYTIRFDAGALPEWVTTYPTQTTFFPDGSHGNSDNSYTIFLEEGEQLQNVNFGNYRKPTVTPIDTTVVEGNAGYTDVQVTLQLSGSFGSPVNVNYHTENGSAIAGPDYTASTGTVRIDPQLAPVPTWDIEPLTDNIEQDYNYGVSGNYVAWEGFDGHDREIFLALCIDGSESIVWQLTDNDTDDRFPSLFSDGAGVNVVWVGQDVEEGDTELFLAWKTDNTAAAPTVKQQTFNYFDDRDPQVSDSLITWWGDDGGGDNEILVLELAHRDNPEGHEVYLTSNLEDDRNPVISGRNIAWTGLRGSNDEIFVFDGEDGDLAEPEIIRVTNANHNELPQIDGNQVVWQAKVGVTHDIYLYNIETAVTTRITSDTNEDAFPQISGNNIVWQHNDGANSSIYLYNTVAQATPASISSGSYNDMPQIEGNNVIWRSFNNAVWDIYYRNLSDNRIVNISNSPAYDYGPQISDAMAIWRTSDNGADFEIVRAFQNAAEVTATVTLRVRGETAVEGDEDFYLVISSDDPSVVIPDNEARITILNDDGTLDFGDAPDPNYPTLLVNNGARHLIVTGVHLGAGVDAETNGKPGDAATGDDLSIGDDEDGVVFSSSLSPGTPVAVTVNVSLRPTDPVGYLDAWIDFDGDGQWDDDNEERIFVGTEVHNGENSLTFNVPVSAVLGNTYARFRLNTVGALSNKDPEHLDTPGYVGQALNGEVEDYLVAIVSQPAIVTQVVTLYGTDGDDEFHFYAGDTLRVSINGIEHEYPAFVDGDPASVHTILFDGRKGKDTVYFHGSDQDESVELWTNRGVFKGPESDGSGSPYSTPHNPYRYLVDTTNVEVITTEAWHEVVDGKQVLKQDADSVILHDSAGDDVFTSDRYLTPGETPGDPPVDNGVRLAKMQIGNEVTLKATGYNTVQAISSGGQDTAHLYGSTASDEFTASPGAAEMKTGMTDLAGGFQATEKADGFRYVHAYGLGYENGDAQFADKATVADSAGDDIFTSNAYYADPGRPEPEYRRTRATMVGPGYDVAVNAFVYVTAAGGHGGIDHANLYDSPGTDVFNAWPTTVNLKTVDSNTPPKTLFQATANKFRYTAGVSTWGGSGDSASFFDSTGNDTFEASPTYAKLYGDTFYNRADHFRTVAADGQAGGQDVVRLYDSAGDDEVIAGVEDMTLFGTGFQIKASFFDHLVAFATTGNDIARFFGTTGADTFLGTPTYAKLSDSGNTRSLRAYGFDTVVARGNDGDDVAYLQDSHLGDLLITHDPDAEFDKAWAELGNDDLEFCLQVTDFETVNAYSTSAGDQYHNDTAAVVDYLVKDGLWEEI